MVSLKIRALQNCILMALFLLIIIATCKSELQKFCGNRLTESLKMVCHNKYNNVGKKSIAITDYYDDDVSNFENFEGMPFLNKLYAGVMTPNIRRIRQGIVNECCKKPCTLLELSAYCDA